MTLLKKNHVFLFVCSFQIFLNTIPYGSKRTLNLFRHLPNFSSHWSSQSTVLDFWSVDVLFFMILLFFFFVNMQRGAKISTSPEFSSQWSSQKYCIGFVKFWASDFLTDFLNSPFYPIRKQKTNYLKNEWNGVKLYTWSFWQLTG